MGKVDGRFLHPASRGDQSAAVCFIPKVVAAYGGKSCGPLLFLTLVLPERLGIELVGIDHISTFAAGNAEFPV